MALLTWILPHETKIKTKTEKLIWSFYLNITFFFFLFKEREQEKQFDLDTFQPKSLFCHFIWTIFFFLSKEREQENMLLHTFFGKQINKRFFSFDEMEFPSTPN
uniref:Uncharacterized protein n=2 Tax=Micrurus spixii TaxID=129469 RepID=A0A2D4M9R4_9SAUR